jgi:hypothetical protein
VSQQLFEQHGCSPALSLILANQSFAASGNGLQRPSASRVPRSPATATPGPGVPRPFRGGHRGRPQNWWQFIFSGRPSERKDRRLARRFAPGARQSFRPGLRPIPAVESTSAARAVESADRTKTPFVDDYRTKCYAPEGPFRLMLDQISRLELAA